METKEILRCHICWKLKGQPPERCNGHYALTSSDPAALDKTLMRPASITELKADQCRLDTLERYTVYVYEPEGGALVLYRRPGASPLRQYIDDAIVKGGAA